MSTQRRSTQGAGAQQAGTQQASTQQAGTQQPSTQAVLPADAIVVGRIEGAWGIRGWVRVVPFNDPRESVLLGQNTWWLRGRGTTRVMQVEAARAHGDALVAKPLGVEDRDAAAGFDGYEVLLSRSDFPPPSGDEFYWVDLIGCTVRNPAGDVLGVVVGVDHHSAHPVLRLTDAGPSGEPAPERLIPMVPAYILEIDIEHRSILADWARDYW